MSNAHKDFTHTLQCLLSKKLPESKAKSLKDSGYDIKNPTGYDAVMVALFEKAISGDLSAIKELRSITFGETTSQSGVLIVDDTAKPP